MRKTIHRRPACIALALTMTISSVFGPGTAGITAAKKARLASKNLNVKAGSKVTIVIRNKNKKAKYTFSSSRTGIATVSKKGVITGKKTGKTKVTVTEILNKKKRSLGVIKVKVTAKNALISVDKPSATPGTAASAANSASQAASSTSAPGSMNNATATPKPKDMMPRPTSTPSPKATGAPPTRTPLVLDDVSTPSDFIMKKSDVTYGSYEKITYHSGVTGTDRHAIVLTPPDYNPDEKYPVLYLCHGGNGDENDWLDGKPELMYGNLLANEETVPMIMVLVNCRARANDGPNPSDSLSDAHMQAWTDFLYELQDDLMPYMQNNYPVLTGRENTAIAGLSMGGRESLYIGFNIPDKISYIGAFSPAFGIFEYENFGYYEKGYFTEDTFTLPDEYKDNTTIMIMNGANDSMVRDEPEKYHNVLVNNDVNHYYYTIPGDHNMDVWKNGLYNFLKVVFK